MVFKLNLVGVLFAFSGHKHFFLDCIRKHFMFLLQSVSRWHSVLVLMKKRYAHSLSYSLIDFLSLSVILRYGLLLSK